MMLFKDKHNDKHYICSKLTIKTPEQLSTVFIVNSEHISHLSISAVGFEQVAFAGSHPITL